MKDRVRRIKLHGLKCDELEVNPKDLEELETFLGRKVNAVLGVPIKTDEEIPRGEINLYTNLPANMVNATEDERAEYARRVMGDLGGNVERN